MKNNIRKIFVLFNVLAIVVTSLVPLNVNAVSSNTQIIKTGGSKTTSDGVYVSKTISPTNMENYFDIKLVVETKSEVSKITVPPSDVSIVLVVDESGSMGECMDSNKNCESPDRRIDALKDALTGTDVDGKHKKGFLESFIEESQKARGYDPNVIRELGLVSFATYLRDDKVALTNYNTTDFQSTFSNAFSNLSIAEGGFNTDDEAATNPAIALAKAREMLSASRATNKYIIFLTDGYPTRYFEKNANGSYKKEDGKYVLKGAGSRYDDTSAYYARLEADANKAAGIKTYTIGVGVGGQSTYTNHQTSSGTSVPVRQDSSLSDYEVGYTMSNIDMTTYQFDTSNNSLNNMVGKEIVIALNNAQNSEAMSLSGKNLLNASNLSTTLNERDVWVIERRNNNPNQYRLRNKATGLYLALDTASLNNNNSNHNKMVSSRNEASLFNIKQNNDGTVVISTNYNNTDYNIRRRDNNSGWGLRSGYSSDLYLATFKNEKVDVPVSGPEQFKRWLGGAAKDGNTLTNRGIGYITDVNASAYYDVSNYDGLQQAYASIFASIEKEIQKISSAWIVNDPMNGKSDEILLPEYIEFVNFYDTDGRTPLVNGTSVVLSNSNSLTDGVNDNDFSFSDDTILWNLRKSDYLSKETNGNVTTYHYELNYRIRLKNETAGFVDSKEYDTNGETILNYVLVNNGVAGDIKEVSFKIPSVKGYLVDLSFVKTSKLSGTAIAGNVFKLSHDPNCECHRQLAYATIGDTTRTSSSSTTNNVQFKNIASGHKYILEETTPASGFTKNGQKYYISVDLDAITIKDGTGANANTVTSLNVKNDPISKELLVSKIVNAKNTKGNFTFKITLSYDNKPLSSIDDDYKKITVFINGVESTLILNDKGEATFTLQHDQVARFTGLPVGVNYTIEEIQANGYYTEICVNENSSCLLSTNSIVGVKTELLTLKNGLNKVEFVNNSEYELPETGSAGMLISMIVASILLGAPIIYLIYTFIKKGIKAVALK